MRVLAFIRFERSVRVAACAALIAIAHDAPMGRDIFAVIALVAFVAAAIEWAPAPD